MPRKICQPDSIREDGSLLAAYREPMAKFNPRSRPADRYTATAVTLHWLIAILVVGMIGFGWWLAGARARRR
jgi:hypothetical protein